MRARDSWFERAGIFTADATELFGPISCGKSSVQLPTDLPAVLVEGIQRRG